MNVPLESAVSPLVLRDDQGGVATLTLNRPAQFNAIIGAMLTEFQAELDAIADDASVRVVVIAGAGSAFCPGHDLKEMLANSNEAFVGDLFRRCSDVMLTLQRIAAAGDRDASTASRRRPAARSSPPATSRSPKKGRGSRRRASISDCSARRPACQCRATSRASARSRCC